MEATGPRLVLYGVADAEFRIVHFADLHLGNRACAKAELDADITAVLADPYALWTLGGDYVESISYDDPRFDPECVDPEIQLRDMGSLFATLRAMIVRRFRPIAQRGLGACLGNHEQKYLTATQQQDGHAVLCRVLDVANLRYSGWLDVYFEHRRGLRRPVLIKSPSDRAVRRKGQRRLRIYIHHGFGAAGTAGGKVNMLKRLHDNVETADLIFSGHLHDELAKVFPRLAPDAACRRIRSRQTVTVMAGSYLRTYAEDMVGYGEQRGYSPAVIGCTAARFRPGTGQLIGEMIAEDVGETY